MELKRFCVINHYTFDKDEVLIKNDDTIVEILEENDIVKKINL